MIDFSAGGQMDVRERFRDDEPGQSIGRATWVSAVLTAKHLNPLLIANSELQL